MPEDNFERPSPAPPQPVPHPHPEPFSHARRIVEHNYPEADLGRDYSSHTGSTFWIFNRADNALLSDTTTSENAAWESALFELTKLNAWLLWKEEGKPLFDAAVTEANWLRAQERLERE